MAKTRSAAPGGTSDAPLTITPPFGYSELQPLSRTDRVLLPHGSTPRFCRAVNALAISRGEFVAAGRDYPVAFAETAGTYAPVAILGLTDRQNLFVGDSGEWDDSTYLPAFVRRYPFCIAKVMVEGKPRPDRVVCVEKAYIDAQGVALYDNDAKSTPQWQHYERLLEEYENDLDQTQQMCAELAKLELFAPFQFQVMEGGKPSLTVKGMHRIDEKKLAALKPASHTALISKGYMGCIYAHFHSLENFGRLYRRAAARAADEARRRKEAVQR
jgi:hypothetical protein